MNDAEPPRGGFSVAVKTRRDTDGVCEEENGGDPAV